MWGLLFVGYSWIRLAQIEKKNKLEYLIASTSHHLSGHGSNIWEKHTACIYDLGGIGYNAGVHRNFYGTMCRFGIVLIDLMCMICTILCISTCIIKYIFKSYMSLYVLFIFLKLKQWFFLLRKNDRMRSFTQTSMLANHSFWHS